MNLSSDQKKAYDKIISNKNILTIGGYAGTGKTYTLMLAAKELAESNLRVLVTCFTGKAAQRLRDVFGKIPSNITINNFHQVIYQIESTENDKLVFKKKHDWYTGFDFILVDESSMVDENTYRDIVSSGKPIVFFGDPFQLPPVGKNRSLIDNPEILLTEVFRQDKGYVLDVATRVRQNDVSAVKDLPAIQYEDIYTHIEEYNPQAIFFSNNDRIGFNRMYRSYFVSDCDSPVPGDKLICLKNNHLIGIYNGTQMIVKEVETFNKFNNEYNLISTECGFDFVAPQSQFYQNKVEKHPEFIGDMLVAYCDYAYGITAHKSQGSQYCNIIFNNPNWLKNKDVEYYKRWVYTVITRAEKECHVF